MPSLADVLMCLQFKVLPNIPSLKEPDKGEGDALGNPIGFNIHLAHSQVLGADVEVPDKPLHPGLTNTDPSINSVPGFDHNSSFFSGNVRMCDGELRLRIFRPSIDSKEAPEAVRIHEKEQEQTRVGDAGLGVYLHSFVLVPVVMLLMLAVCCTWVIVSSNSSPRFVFTAKEGRCEENEVFG